MCDHDWTVPIETTWFRECMWCFEWVEPPEAARRAPYRIEDTCCGKCTGPCYVDQVTGA